MALFGLGGYNEKTYAKNTERIKEQITELNQAMLGGKFPGAGATINAVLFQFGQYPKRGNPKEMAAIDDRIFDLLEKMMQDIQQDKPGKLSGHANMLLAAVSKSRKYGKEAYPQDQLKAQEIMAECNANIEEHLFQKEELAKQMDALKRKGKLIAQDNPNSVELQRLQIKYAELNKELKRVEQNLNLWVTQYNNTVSQLKVMEDGQAYTEISATDLQTPAEFSKKVQAVSAQLDRIVTNQQGIADLAGEYEAGKDEGVRSVASSDDGGFMDAINSSDDVNSDIFGATTTARNVDGAANNAPKTANWFD